FETAPEEMGPPQHEREKVVALQEPPAHPEILSSLSSGLGELAELCSIPVGVGFEHPPDGVQELAHDRHKRLQRLFASSQELFVESADMRLALTGDQGRHVEDPA